MDFDFTVGVAVMASIGFVLAVAMYFRGKEEAKRQAEEEQKHKDGGK
jgi:hypothetical protein